MILKEKTTYKLTPEFSGTAKIVDMTETKTYASQYGEREAFRFILEMDEFRDEIEETRWTCVSNLMTPSLAPKANLRKFIEKVLGRKLTDEERNGGFDVETMIGKYAEIITEHVESGDNTYCNLTYFTSPKDGHPEWESEYVRIRDREKDE